MLIYDEAAQTLFTSDLFLQPGDREPITEEDRSAEVVKAARLSGAFPSQKLLEWTLNRIEALDVGTLACHHGSVLKGDPHRYYRALRRYPIGDIVEAGVYGARPSVGAAE